jgi:hypothetical protein
MKKFEVLLAVVLLGTSLIAEAQSVPTLINYQGQLVDASGAPLTNGNYSLTARIYSSDPGGALLWGPQTLPNVALVAGRFNVVLGPYDASFRAISTAFSNATAYLEMQLGANPPIVPRQQILSAPYSLKAGAADSATDSAHLAGFGWDAVFTDTGRPDTGHLPGSKLADAAVTTSKIANLAITTPLIATGAVTGVQLDLHAGGVNIGAGSGAALLDVATTNGPFVAHFANSSGIFHYVFLADGTYAIYAGGNMQLYGNANITGTLTKSSGTFKIDHPLDPANKYLSHSFVESPDMKNIYDGVAVLDQNGEGEVVLPNWFEALNKDFRYQLTAIGAPGPNLYIAQELAHNRFRIAGGTGAMKVSWQVTGVRHDAYANAHRTPIEEDKPLELQGSYLHPAEHGQPSEKSEQSVRPQHLASEQR